MTCPIKRPVRADNEGTIFDANGTVLANFCYRNDYDHVQRQVEKAKFVADLINMFHEDTIGILNPVGDAAEQESEGNGHGDPKLNGLVTTIAAEIIEGVKRKGNPAFQKGQPNPYGKKKDDPK